MINMKVARYELLGKCNFCGDCCRNESCEWFIGDRCNHYKKRPPKCQNYPSAPPIIHKRCGYYFWDRWENKIVKPGEI